VVLVTPTGGFRGSTQVLEASSEKYSNTDMNNWFQIVYNLHRTLISVHSKLKVISHERNFLKRSIMIMDMKREETMSRALNGYSASYEIEQHTDILLSCPPALGLNSDWKALCSS
jgi:hypothetical protein